MLVYIHYTPYISKGIFRTFLAAHSAENEEYSLLLLRESISLPRSLGAFVEGFACVMGVKGPATVTQGMAELARTVGAAALCILEE